MGFKIIALTVIALTVCVSGNAELITNGGFETGDFSGWTLSGKINLGYYEGVCASGSIFSYAACTSHSGNYAAVLGPDGPAVHLYQDVDTTVGSTYLLKFWLRNDNLDWAPDNQFDVFFGNANTFSQSNADSSGFAEFAISGLVASSPSTRIDFTITNVPGGFFLDDVSLNEVPEPASMLLVAGSAGVVSLIRIRRRARQNAA